MIPFLNDPRSAFGVHYDAAPCPWARPARKPICSSSTPGASARTKFPKAAAALVAFLASRENEDAMLQTGFALPALMGMENDPFFKGAGVVNQISALLYQTGRYGTPDYFGGKHDNEIKTAFAKANQQVFAHQLSPRAALDQACATIDALLATGSRARPGRHGGRPARQGRARLPEAAPRRADHAPGPHSGGSRYSPQPSFCSTGDRCRPAPRRPSAVAGTVRRDAGRRTWCGRTPHIGAPQWAMCRVSRRR